MQFFFAISGFVIARGFLNEEARTGAISLTAFYARRAFRILPPLVFYVAVIYALASAGVVESHAKGALQALTFTCNFPNAQCGGPLGQHTWSLSYEEQFYLVVPILFVAITAARRWLLTAIILALPLVCIALFLLDADGAGGFLSSFLVIGCGVLAALHEQRLRRLIDATPWLVIVVAVVALYFIRVAAPGKIFTLVNIFAFSPLIVLILFATSFKPGPLARLLAARPMVMLGQASYGIYLWQQLATHSFAGAGVGFYAASITLCLLGTLLMFNTVEKRLIAMGAQFSKGRAVLAASPAQ